jgi:hypothetical protein
MHNAVEAVVIALDMLATIVGCLLVYFAFVGRWPWE